MNRSHDIYSTLMGFVKLFRNNLHRGEAYEEGLFPQTGLLRLTHFREESKVNGKLGLGTRVV